MKLLEIVLLVNSTLCIHCLHTVYCTIGCLKGERRWSQQLTLSEGQQITVSELTYEYEISSRIESKFSRSKSSLLLSVDLDQVQYSSILWTHELSHQTPQLCVVIRQWCSLLLTHRVIDRESERVVPRTGENKGDAVGYKQANSSMWMWSGECDSSTYPLLSYQRALPAVFRFEFISFLTFLVDT